MARPSATAPLALALCYALAPVLALYANNAGQTALSSTLLPAGLVAAATLVIFPLFARLFGGPLRGGVATALLWLVVFSYGHAALIIGRFPVAGFNFANPKALLPATLVVCLVAARAVRRAKSEPRVLAQALMVGGLAMIGTSSFHIARYHMAHDAAPAGATIAAEEIRAGTVARKPDIYYIIFDRYASNATLRARYDFDNTPVLDFLRGRGFYIAEDSRSNYLVTAQSLASSLSMAHLLPLSDSAGRESTDWLPVFSLIGENRIAAFLADRGYRYVHIGSSWQPTAKNGRATVNYQYRRMPEFSAMLLSTTAFYPVLYRMGVSNPDQEKYDRVRQQLDVIPELADADEAPLFLFAHFLVPHGPFVFNADGSYRTPAQADAHDEPANYLEQVRFLNTRIRTLVDGILEKYPAGAQPVIILQGDEGPYPSRTQPHSFDWTGASDEELSEKMRILNAIYAPGCESRFYPAMTPVNTFRLLFNCYFGTNLPLLSDRSYAYRDLRHLYDFVETTERINAAAR